MSEDASGGRTIAVLGSGTMGRALAAVLARRGFRVLLASRDAERARGGVAAVRALLDADGGTRVSASLPSAAVIRSEMVVLATRWAETFEMLESAGKFGGRILIDASNPEAPDGRSLAVGHTTSGAEEISRRAVGARVVKAFNHVYAEVLARGPEFGAERASVFLCGDDSEAKAAVTVLARELGFSPVDAGALSAARLLEPAAALMVQIVRVVGREPGSVALALLSRTEGS